MRIIICLVAILFCFSLIADLIQMKNERANQFEEAGFSLDAEQMYLSLLQEGLKPWERNVVLYNLGTSYLKKGKLEDALHAFVQVDYEQAPPYLITPFLNNLALAARLKAEQFEKENNYFLSSLYFFIAKEFLPKKEEQIRSEIEIELQEVKQKLKESLAKENATVPSLLIETILSAPIEKNNLSTLLDSNIASENTVSETLIRAKEAFDSGTHTASRLFLIHAFFTLSQEKNKELFPAQNLSQALTLQKEGKEIATLAVLFGIKQDIDKPILADLLSMQLQVINSATLFPKDVIAWQRERVETASSEITCLDEPWIRVIPLFEKGFVSANQAKGFLLEKKLLSLATEFQKETIDYWTIALETMQEEAKPKQDKKPKKQSKLIKQIIQMNLQDEIIEPAPAKVRTVEYPW